MARPKESDISWTILDICGQAYSPGLFRTSIEVRMIVARLSLTIGSWCVQSGRLSVNGESGSISNIPVVIIRDFSFTACLPLVS
jgi:hypothetical protein